MATFFPAPHGKEMTSLLHKLDFLCSWKEDINAVSDDVSPGGTGPQQPGELTADLPPSFAPRLSHWPGGPHVQAERNLAPLQFSK